MESNRQQYVHCFLLRQKAVVILLVLILVWLRNKNSKRSKCKGVRYGPLIHRDVWRTSELIRLIDTSDRICTQQLRMPRQLFYRLCSRLKNKGLLVDTFHVSVEEQVAMFLKKVGQHHSVPSVGFSFWRSGETVSRYFHIVLRAMCELARELIYVRSTDTHTKITSNPNKFYPYFKVTLNTKRQ